MTREKKAMEKREGKRRIVLVPIPAKGHVTPMMQLGKALYSKGFSITVVEGHFNQVSSFSQHSPGFQFININQSLPESEFQRLGGIEFMIKLNKTSEASFKDCIAQLLLQKGSDIACIIYEEFMYFCGAVAKELNLPSVIFSTESATNYVSRFVQSKLNADKFLVDMEDPEMQEKVVENLYPLRYKDLATSGMGPLDRYFEFCREVVNKRTAFIKKKTWSWGLCDSNQPLLWVIRDGSESLPEEVSKMVSERGYIVKWAPQIKVLGHPAVGGFWSHCGWKSTLESIGEGVPMICRPFNGEQKLNAMYIESVWRIGFQVEGKVDRGEVERAVKRLIVDEEGVGVQERALVLKEKLKASVRSGGASYDALNELVKYLKTK